MRYFLSVAALGALAAGAAVGVAGCGSAPAPDPLRGISAPAIAARAVAGTEAAASLRVAGQGASAGQSLSFDFTVASGRGCTGTVTESEAGSFRLIESGPAVWVQPDDAYYRSAAARGAVVPLAALSGKYLRETPGKSALGSLGYLCQLNPLLAAFRSEAARFGKGGVTTVGGVQALRLSAGSASLFVTDTASPRLVKISAPGTATYSFSGYNAPAAISAPPPAQVADGAAYGF